MKETHPVELLILAAAALLWALWQVARPVIVLVWALVALAAGWRPRRRAAAPSPVMAPAPAAATPEPALAAPVAPAPAAPWHHPLALLAAELEALPVAELRRMAGTRRRVGRAVLLASLLAMPV